MRKYIITLSRLLRNNDYVYMYSVFLNKCVTYLVVAVVVFSAVAEVVVVVFVVVVVGGGGVIAVVLVAFVVDPQRSTRRMSPSRLGRSWVLALASSSFFSGQPRSRSSPRRRFRRQLRCPSWVSVLALSGVGALSFIFPRS